MGICIFILICIIIHASVKVFYSIKYSTLGLFEFVLCWFVFIYCISPLFIIYSNDFINVHYRHLIIPSNNYVLESIFILASYIFIIIGGATIKKTNWIILTKSNNDQTLFTFAIFFLVISFIAWTIYVSMYGGVSYVLNNISQIRSGVAENKSYLGSFFSMFTNLISISFFICIFLFFKKKIKKISLYHLFFIIIIIVTFLRALTSGGRANIVLLLMSLLLSIYFLKQKLPIIFIIIFSLAAFFFILFGKVYIFMLMGDQSLDFYEVNRMQQETGYLNFFIQEFNHQFVSLSNFIQNEYDYRYFKDYFIWLLKPLKLLNSNDTYYDSISYYNTYLTIGKWQSDIPPGFIALAYINGGGLGVLLQSFLFGRILKWIDLLMNNSNFRGNGTIFVIYLISFNSVWFAFQNGDIALIIQSQLPFLILLMSLFLTRHISLRKF